MITLFGSKGSPNTARVQWCLEELGTPYTTTLLDLAKGEQKKPEYVAINPNGRVPTLRDGDYVVWESAAIIAYLGDAYGAGRLVPSDAKGRGTVLQWLFWQNSDLGPHVGAPWYLKLNVRMGRGPLDPAAFAASVEKAHATLALFDRMLAGKDWLAGSAFSLADLSAAESVHLATISEVDLARHPNVARWFTAATSRDAFKKVHPF